MSQANSEDDRKESAGASQHGRPVGRSRRRRVLLLGGVICLVGLASWGAVRIYRSRWMPAHNAIAEVAADATPEVAALLREANQVANRLLREFPESPEAVHVMARLYYRFGKAEEGVQLSQRCLELDPNFGPAYHAIGVSAMENGEYQKAADYLREAIELDPGASAFPVQLAEVLINQGKLEEAVEVLEKNLESYPRSMASLALLGQAYVQLKEYQKARTCLEKAIEIGPGYTNAYYGLATACARLGDQDKSQQYMERFKALKARDEQTHREGLKLSDDAATVGEAVADIYAAAGNVYLAHGDVQTAEAHLLKAAGLAPNHVTSREVLAWLYERQGRTEEALKMLAELSNSGRDDLGVQMRVGALYAQLRRFDEAERAYKRAIELTPRQAGGYATLADLYLQAGRKLPEAKLLALKAVDLEPVARYFAVLSVACQRNGDLAGAVSAIDQAIAAEPDNEDYQRARTWIQETIRRGSPGGS